MVGRAIAIDLAAKNTTLTSFDVSDHALHILTQNNSIKTIKADLSNYSSYNSMLSSFDYVISAIAGFMGYKTLGAIINGKKCSGYFHFSGEFVGTGCACKENDHAAVVDCGVAPGMRTI
ncbi:MAG: hypothetical protein IPN43_17015 [Chitinophagaceae bacterium]|nr:hypothetical protein [Chitinophagaceae bacterium]